MDRNWAEQGVKPEASLQAIAGMCLVLQGILVRPARFELATSCSGGKQLPRAIYHLGRKNGR